ncbi:unnamed protein product [Amaranthus hypochondriacus]
MAALSNGGLTFKLHSLVILNISDHFTRIKSQLQHSSSVSNGGDSSPPPRVYGCVIGIQQGRTVEIFNSFELLYGSLTNFFDPGFLEKKQELYKKLFPNFYVLGWYSTGIDAQESDMFIHKALIDINESPGYVLLHRTKGSSDEHL